MNSDNNNFKELYIQLKEINDIVHKIDSNSIHKIGDDFFQSMVNSLSKTLNADFTFIAEISQDYAVAETLYMSVTGQKGENMSYDLPETPCRDVANENVCIYLDRVQQSFPKDVLLVDMGINAYAGVPIPIRDQEKVWILVALFKDPIENKDYWEHLLSICAQKIKAERDRTALLTVIQEREAKYRDLFDNVNDPIAILDNHGVILNHNKAFSILTGYSSKELLQLSLKEIVHPDEIANVIEGRKALLVKGDFQNLESQIIRKDGSTAWVQVSSSAIYDSKGQLIGSQDVARDITAQKIAKEELKESEQQLKEVFNSFLDIYYEVDFDGKFTMISPSVETILGYTPQELLGTAIIDTYKYPQDRKKLIQKILKEGQINNFQATVYHKNGQEIYIETNSKLKKDKEGNTIGIQGIVRDITNRKKSELELDRTRKILHETSQLSKIGGWEINLATRQIYWSDIVKRIHGLPPDYAIESIRETDFVHDDFYKKKAREVISFTMETGQPYDLELPIITTTNEHKWVRTIGNSEFKDGKCIRIYGTIQDITKQKLLEEKLAKANEAEFAKLYQQQKTISQQLEHKSKELNRFFELSVDMLCIMDKHTLPQRVTPSFSRALGYTEKELYGQPLIKLAHPDDIEITKKTIAKVLNGLDITDFVMRMLTKTGAIRWFSWSGTLDPNTLHIHTVAHDITDRIQLEADLRQAKEEAIRSARVKEDFLANMSHEIRTPMNAILGFSELLLQTNLAPVQNDYSKAIYSSAENLLVVINDILDLSKIESGKFELEKFDFDFSQNIQTVSTLFKANAEQKKLDFIVQINNSIPQYIYSSPNRIAQVLINLLSNAIKFTKKGSVKLQINKVEDKEELLFEVIDTGIGIPPEKLKYIFENFTQAEDYTTRMYGGTGLGLSISQKLVSLMGGELSVRSELGKGSTFFFSIPLQIGKAPIMGENPLLESTSVAIINQPKILVVDDNVLNRKLVAVRLKHYNCTYDFAVNGQEAIGLTNTQQYDLILMDIQMPVMDGIEATIKIREVNPTIPIVAITAHALQREKQKCFEIGMNDYLSKPFKKEDFHEMLMKYLGHSSIGLNRLDPKKSDQELKK
ncbi:MAG: PAS domain S-box protein [Aureispira sp.]|nr:PAS domain S-box protein [Aureispira sp.]